MDDIRMVLSDAVFAHTTMENSINSIKVVESIFNLLEEEKVGIIKANKVDLENKNGFELDIDRLLSLKQEFVAAEDEYRKVISMNINKEINYMIGFQTDKLGTICVCYDGNTYIMLEMLLKALITHNSIIFSSESNYMQGTNDMILVLVRRILEAYNIDKNLVQRIFTTRYEKLLSNSASIKKVIAIGNKDFQEKINKYSTVEVVSSGYGYYDIYIEDETNMELIIEILDSNPNINIYVKEGIELPYYEVTKVLDLDEGIGMINANTARYSASIFTNSPENGSRFLREISCKNVSVNSSPLLDNKLDIEIEKILNVKKLFYPNPFKRSDDKEFEFPTARAILENNKAKEQEEAIEKAKEENQLLKEENKKMSFEMTDKLNAKEQEIENLKLRLLELQTLANKYMDGYRKSFLCRLFANVSKQDIENDTKILPDYTAK